MGGPFLLILGGAKRENFAAELFYYGSWPAQSRIGLARLSSFPAANTTQSKKNANCSRP